MADETTDRPKTSEEFLATLPFRSEVARLRGWVVALSLAVMAFSLTELQIQKLAVPGTSIEIVPPRPAELRMLLTSAVGLVTQTFLLVVAADQPRLREQWRQIVKSEHGVVRPWRYFITHRSGRPFLAAVLVWIILPAALGWGTFIVGGYIILCPR